MTLWNQKAGATRYDQNTSLAATVVVVVAVRVVVAAVPVVVTASDGLTFCFGSDILI